MYKSLCALLMLVSTLVFSSTPKIEEFAKLPMLEQPQLSPDGSMTAMIINNPNGPQVMVTSFGKTDFRSLVGLKKSRDRVDYIRWSGNKYILVGLSFPEYLGGTHYRVSRIYSINVKSGDAQRVESRRLKKQKFYDYYSHKLISSLKNDEDHILVSMHDEQDEGVSVFKVNLEKNKFKKVVNNSNEYAIDHWYSDSRGVVKLGIDIDKSQDKHSVTTWFRTNEKDPFTKLHTREMGKGDTFDVIGLSDEGQAYILSDRQTRRQSLWSYDIKEGQFKDLLFSHEQYDIKGALINNVGDIIGAYYYDDFFRAEYFNSQDANDERAAQNLLKGLQATIVSRSADKTKLLIKAESDTRVPTYYYIDKSTNKAGAWLSKYPQFTQTAFPTVQNYEFKTSDGVTLSGYLTLPQNKKSPPLIVFPHGGPHARDYKYFDPYLQFFVAQGYAVLQVNFRGSSGFGSDFETDGYFEWGKRMQQDVYEAMDWAKSTGQVSTSKSCVVGFSYGGYVALTAAFQEPKRFDCIASIAGISDLKTMVEKDERSDFYVGNIVDPTDKVQLNALAEVSAINYFTKIKAPVLLIHGTNDTSVSYQQSNQFYKKAKKHIDVKYVEIDDATHYFDDAESRKVLLSELADFLDSHL